MAHPFRNSGFVLLLGMTTLIVGCDEYVPSPEKLRLENNPSRAFIIDEQDIHGICAYSDVDSAIYAYVTQAGGENAFWNQIEEQASAQNWKLSDDHKHFRHYVRIIPRQGEQAYHSVEEVRIALDANSKQVTVAWVQSDQRDLPTDFPSTGPEGTFAKDVVWPRFEQLIADNRPSN